MFKDQLIEYINYIREECGGADGRPMYINSLKQILTAQDLGLLNVVKNIDNKDAIDKKAITFVSRFENLLNEGKFKDISSRRSGLARCYYCLEGDKYYVISVTDDTKQLQTFALNEERDFSILWIHNHDVQFTDSTEKQSEHCNYWINNNYNNYDFETYNYKLSNKEYYVDTYKDESSKDQGK